MRNCRIISSKKGVLTTYFHVVNHFSGTHITYDAIAKTDSKIACYVVLSNNSPLEFDDEDYIELIKFPHAYDKYVLKYILVKGL